MSARRRSRQRALQILFIWDVRKQSVDEAAGAFFETLYSEEGKVPPRNDTFLVELIHGVVEHAAEIDSHISHHAEHWRIERMPAVDRNILRLAVYELLKRETPPPVVIDEALELARRYSNEESVQFVNGVLDAINRSLRPAVAAPAQPG